MAKLSAKEVRGLSQAFAEMRGDSEKAQANLEAMLATQDKGIRSLDRQFKKLRVTNLRELKKERQEIQKLLDKKKELTEEEEKSLKVLKNSVKEREKVGAAINKLAANTQDFSSATKDNSGIMSQHIAKIQKYASVVGVLSLAFTTINKLYTIWANLQIKITQGMGQAAQALGGTARQMEGFQRRASDLRETFSSLEGDVDGWTMSMQNLQDTALALRRNMDTLSSGVEGAMLRTARGFGIGIENAGQLFRLLETGVAGSGTSIDEFGADMLHFSENIGANASQIVSDFVDARSSIAQFGDEGVETFRNAAMMANEFGFETRRIFDMMRGFDTFSQASQNVNQLNAILGTTMSSYEIMLEQDPARRLEIIRNELSATGQTWGSMSRQARQALSQVTGESEDILARVFGQGRSLEEVQAQEAQEERRRQKRQKEQEDAQETMYRLLQRTAVVWDNMDRIIERIWIDLSKTLGPVFEVFHSEVAGIATEFRNWLREMVQSGQAGKFIRGIAQSIREMFATIRTTWEEWKPTVITITSAIMGILSFAAEHPGVIAALFAGVGIARFGALLSRIPGVMSLLGSAPAAGGASSLAPAIGAALPLLALAGGAEIAKAGEQARIDEGIRSTTDLTTQRRLAQTGLEALRNRRGESAEERRHGRRQGGILGAWRDSASAVASIASEHLDWRSTEFMRSHGFRTGQEADQMRNSLPYTINDIIRGELGVPTDDVARRIYQAYGDRVAVDEAVGMRLRDYIEQQRGNAGAMGEGGNIEPPTSATESSSATTRTATSAPATMNGMSEREIFLYSRLEIDGQVVANSLERRAMR